MSTFRELRLRSGLSVNKLARRADVDYKTAKRADDGEPIQELKAVALVGALSQALGQPLSPQDINGLKIYSTEAERSN